jgi:hypothetical protein
MSAGTFVVARVELEGFHRWENAPVEARWLRDQHRHIFVVKAWAAVNHDDRDREFILLGREIREYLFQTYGEPMNLETKSCEMLGRELIEQFGLSRCEVWEDDENGAVVYA